MVFQIPKLPIFGRSAVVQPGAAESSASSVTSSFGIAAPGEKKAGFVSTPASVSGPNPWALPPALSPTLGGMLAHDAFFSDASLKAQLNRYLKQSAPKEPLTLTLGYREGKHDGMLTPLWQRFLPDMQHMIIVTPQTRRTLRSSDPFVSAADASDTSVSKPKFKKTRGLQATQYTVLTLPKSQFGPLNALLNDLPAGQPHWVIQRAGQSLERLETPRGPEKLGYQSSTPPIKQWFHEMLSGWLNTLLGWPMAHGLLRLPNGRFWPAPRHQWQTAQGDPVTIKQVLKTPKGHWVEVLQSETQPWVPLHQRHNLRSMIDTMVRPWERAGAQLEQAPMLPDARPHVSPLPSLQLSSSALSFAGKPYASQSVNRVNPFMRATMEAARKHNPLMSGTTLADKKPVSQPLPTPSTDRAVSKPGSHESTDPATSV